MPDVDTSQEVYLRTEIYGCRPTPGNGVILITHCNDLIKKIVDDVRLISGIIKVEADIAKTNSNTCFIIHCLEKITTLVLHTEESLILLLQIVHCSRDLQICRQLSSKKTD